MKKLLLITLFPFASLATDLDNMNLDGKYFMYDCPNNNICFTKDTGETYTIEGDYMGNGDYGTFMIPNGTLYGTDAELPMPYPSMRDYLREENGIDYTD